MNILIIQGSPDNKSFSHAVYEKIVSTLEEKQLSIDSIDLSTSGFNPILKYGYRAHMSDESDIKVMQNKVRAANKVIFVFPIWWSAEPAILKGWLDRVLTPGFAYSNANEKHVGLLKNKEAYIFTSSHAPAAIAKVYGGVITRWKHMVLNYCGIKLSKAFVEGNMTSPKDTPARRNEYLKQVASVADNLF